MSSLPKLKIKLPGDDGKEYIFTLEEARNIIKFDEAIFMVEGQGVHSYDALVNVASQDKFRGREYIEVVWLHMIDGG
jgi:hypothetical protein